MIKKILFTIFMGTVGVVVFLYIKNQKKIIKDSNEKVLKFKKYYQIYNQWIKNNTEHYNMGQSILARGYKNIAIYGNGEIGCRLYEELKDTEVKVCCFIDKKASEISLSSDDNIAVYGIDKTEEYKDLDAIIVTTVNIFDEIELQLQNRNIKGDIVSLEDLLIHNIE